MFKQAKDFVVKLLSEFLSENPFQLAGALSFYTLLSLAPLLLVVVAAAGLFWGQTAVRGQLTGQFEQLMGHEGAAVISTIIANASNTSSGILSMVIGLVTLLFGATTVFVQLQSSLNQIWNVRVTKRRNAIWGFLRIRLLSMAIVLGMGFLLLVSLVISAALAAFKEQMDALISGVPWLWELLNFAISLGVVTVLIAMIYKYLPDVRIAWGDVWVGALVTAGLFGVGKFLIGLYLGHASVGSAYGAAGSLVVLLVWVYYSALILFFGAELTQVLLRHRGHEIQPAPYAEPLRG